MPPVSSRRSASSPNTCSNSKSNCGRRSLAKSSPARTCCPCSTQRSLTVPSARAKTSRRCAGSNSPSATTLKSAFSHRAAATMAAIKPAAKAPFNNGRIFTHEPRLRRIGKKGIPSSSKQFFIAAVVCTLTSATIACSLAANVPKNFSTARIAMAGPATSTRIPGAPPSPVGHRSARLPVAGRGSAARPPGIARATRPNIR